MHQPFSFHRVWNFFNQITFFEIMTAQNVSVFMQQLNRPWSLGQRNRHAEDNRGGVAEGIMQKICQYVIWFVLLCINEVSLVWNIKQNHCSCFNIFPFLK